MAIIYIDGFDVYPDVSATSYGVQSEWQILYVAFASNGVGTGRFGGQSIYASTSDAGSCGYGKVVASPTSGMSVGFSFQWTMSFANLSGRSSMMTAYNGTTDVWGVGLNGLGQLYIWTAAGGGYTTPLVTYGTPLSAGAWNHIEAVGTIGASATITVYLNGASVLTYTGNTGSGTCSLIKLGYVADGSWAATWYWDDFFFTNTAAQVGERRVQTLVPSANSTVAWTPLSGSNYANVNELPVNGDTSYVYASTAGTQDLYTTAGLSGTATAISCVQMRTCARKDDSATRQIATVLSSTGTVQVGATQNLTAGYLYYLDLYATDPHTSAAWTQAGVNAALIGQKVIS